MSTPDVLEALRVARDDLAGTASTCRVWRAPGEVCDECAGRERASTLLARLIAAAERWHTSLSKGHDDPDSMSEQMEAAFAVLEVLSPPTPTNGNNDATT